MNLVSEGTKENHDNSTSLWPYGWKEEENSDSIKSISPGSLSMKRGIEEDRTGVAQGVVATTERILMIQNVVL